MKTLVHFLLRQRGRGVGVLLIALTAAVLAAVLTSSAVPARKTTAKFILDHYECYGIKTDQTFGSRTVLLKDQFGTRKAKVVEPESLCNPVQKNGVQIRRHDAHLFCYRISTARMPSRDVLATNQFGPIKLRAVIPYSLCLPSGKGTDKPEPIPARFDHYACYRVKPLAAFKKPTVALADQFWKTKAAVVGVFSLCNPVSKNRGKVVDKSDHLVCYTIKTNPFEPQKVIVHNQFDEARIVEAVTPRLLCVPSLKRELKPDLTVNIVPKLTGAHIPVSCPTGGGSCTTTVEWRLTNLTSVPVTATFQVKISADPGMSTTRTITGFPGSGVQTFTDVLGPGGNCYDPDCTVSVAVDTGLTVDETNEGNNVDTYTVIG